MFLPNCKFERMVSNLQTICDSSKRTFDLTSSNDQDYLYSLVDKVLSFPQSELNSLGNNSESPLSFRIAIKISRSKRYVQSISGKKLKLAVVFAMWGEQNRLQPKSAKNPNGEDLLNVKVEQLAWLFDGTDIDWKLDAVDDGCPNKSGQIAE